MRGSFYFGFDNLLIGETLTPSSEVSGFEAVNTTTWETYSAWQTTTAGAQTLTVDFGSAVSADSFGVAGHNLFSTGSAVALEHSPDGVTWTSAIGTVTPTTNEPIFRKFTSVSKRYWRFAFSSTSAFTIANLFLGVAFQMPKPQNYGGKIAPYHKNHKAMYSRNRTGALLGRSLKYLGGQLTLSFSNMESTWVRSNWETLYGKLMSQAFYVAVDTANYPTEAAYAWVGDDVAGPQWKSSNLVDITLDLETL